MHQDSGTATRTHVDFSSRRALRREPFDSRVGVDACARTTVQVRLVITLRIQTSALAPTSKTCTYVHLPSSTTSRHSRMPIVSALTPMAPK